MNGFLEIFYSSSQFEINVIFFKQTKINLENPKKKNRIRVYEF
jgi:hypothetical protein